MALSVGNFRKIQKPPLSGVLQKTFLKNLFCRIPIPRRHPAVLPKNKGKCFANVSTDLMAICDT